jgi:disulfide bond formation protein DsbB
MPPKTSAPPSWIRRVVGVVALCAVLAGAAWQAVRVAKTGPGWIPVDFMAFWTAGKLHAEGRNPYDQSAVRAVQTAEVSGVGEAVIMWNPPWALAVCTPFGLLSVPLAASLWLLFLLVLVVVAADVLWRVYGGNPARRYVSWLLALTLAPTIYLFAYGQLTAVPLVGVAGFLACVKSKRFFWAGVFGGLTASKPHLFSLFALGLLFEAVRNRDGRKVLLGGLCLGVAATILVSLPNPHVWSDYWAATRGPGSDIHRSLGEWKPPLVGWYLRQFVPGQPFAVQFVPLAIAAVGFSIVWRKKRASWNWREAMPWVMGGSLLAAPYGAWAHDGILLLVPILAVAARFDPGSPRSRLGLLVYLLANVAGYVTYLMHAYGETYVWLNPTILFACWLGSRRVGRLTAHVTAGNSPTRRWVGATKVTLDPADTTSPEGVLR